MRLRTLGLECLDSNKSHEPAFFMLIFAQLSSIQFNNTVAHGGKAMETTSDLELHD